MANTKSTQHEIDLTSELNLNKFKADIKAYNGFNERNAPYYGGCLSPLFIKDDDETYDSVKLYRGHLYKMQNGRLYKDNNVILDTSSAERLEQHVDYTDDTILDTLGFCNENGLEFYVKKVGNNLVVRMGTTSDTDTIVNEQYDDSRFVINYTNKYITLILGTISANVTGVRVYEYKWATSSSEASAVGFIKPANRNTLSTNNTLKWLKSNRIVVSLGSTASSGNTFMYNNNVFTYTRGTTISVSRLTSYTVEVVNYSYVDANDNLHEDATFTYTHNLTNDSISLTGSYPNGETTVSFSDTYDSFDDFAKSQYPYVMKVGLHDAGGFDFIVAKSHGYLHRPGSEPHRTNPVYLTFIGYRGLGRNSYIDMDTIHDRPYEAIVDSNSSYGGSYGVEKAKDYMSLLKYEDYTNNGLGYITASNVLDYPDDEFYNRVMIVSNESEVVYQAQDYEMPLLRQVGVDSKDPLFVPGGHMSYETYGGNFRILGTNDGIVQGVSYCKNNNSSGSIFDIYSQKGDVCPFVNGSIGTLLSPWGSVDDSKNVYIVGEMRDINDTRVLMNHVTYYNLDENKWISYYVQAQPADHFEIIENYIVVNTTDYYNCVNLETGKKDHWASDWNSRYFGATKKTWLSYAFRSSLLYGLFEYRQKAYSSTKLIATAQNPNYLSKYLSSAVFPSEVTLCNETYEYYVLGITSNTKDNVNKVELYEDLTYVKNLDGSSSSILLGSVYPSGETRYNIPLFFTANNSLYNLTIVSFGATSFLLFYHDNRPRYQYLASSIGDFYETFVIQGQSYGIFDNKIFSIQYANNTLQNVNVIVPLDGLQYIGATIYNAYFYSPTAKAIYQFGADNNLTVFAQADTFDKIVGASYIPNTGSIVIGVLEGENSYTYVLNERFGIYRIKEIGATVEAGWIEDDNSILCIEDTGSSRVGHYISYEQMDDFIKKDIILDTSYYGAGSNVVSVNDCWYIRVTNTEHESGEVKLAVSTLTDIGRQTETRTFKIKKDDWDELTDTVYIRFQPKLQRAVGVSLHIESPFKIGYIGVGATPETLQLNKGSI